MNVMISTICHEGKLDVRYFSSFAHTLIGGSKDGITLGSYTLAGEEHIARARNFHAYCMLKDQADKIFFINSNVSWMYEQFLALVRSQHFIIGGVVPVAMLPLQADFVPLSFQAEKYFTGKVPRSLENFRTFASEEADEQGEVHVEQLSTSFLCVTRTVFEHMIRKGVARPYTHINAQTGEREIHHEFFPLGATDKDKDYYDDSAGFAETARQAGFDCYLNTKVTVARSAPMNFEFPSAEREPKKVLSDYKREGNDAPSER